MDKQTLQETVSQILDEMRERPIPLGVSSRHIHLSTADYLRLFPEQPISEKKPLMLVSSAILRKGLNIPFSIMHFIRISRSLIHL